MDRSASASNTYKKAPCPLCGNPKEPKSKYCRRCWTLDGSPPILTEPLGIGGEPCRQVPLTRGLYAIVDADLYDWLMQWKWHAQGNAARGVFYARRCVSKSENNGRPGGGYVFMHRQILSLGRWDINGVGGDHRNQNTLDNRRSNLRLATAAQNIHNRGVPASNTSGFKGVYWNRNVNKWSARIRCDGKVFYLGGFTSKRDAAKAYDAAALKYHGEFACPNFTEVGDGR